MSLTTERSLDYLQMNRDAETKLQIGSRRWMLGLAEASNCEVQSYTCRTQLSSRSSELIAEESKPINKIAMGPDGLLWCATTGSSARCYDVGGFKWMGGGLPGGLPPPSPRTPARTASGKVFHAGPSPQMRHRQRLSRLLSSPWQSLFPSSDRTPIAQDPLCSVGLAKSQQAYI